MFTGPFSESIVKRAGDKGLIHIRIHNIRDFARDRNHVVDDYAYGGGPGMVMKPGPVFEAVEAVRGPTADPSRSSVILLSPQGRVFNQSIAQELTALDEMTLICGHYEGVDERVREHLATDDISIGDYVITGGELAAMVVVDAVARLIPGSLGSEDSAREDSLADGLLQHPQYTRPPSYRGWPVPDVLLSGNHAAIAEWRRHQTLLRTLKRRPDLLEKAHLTDEDWAFLKTTTSPRQWGPAG